MKRFCLAGWNGEMIVIDCLKAHGYVLIARWNPGLPLPNHQSVVPSGGFASARKPNCPLPRSMFIRLARAAIPKEDSNTCSAESNSGCGEQHMKNWVFCLLYQTGIFTLEMMPARAFSAIFCSWQWRWGEIQLSAAAVISRFRAALISTQSSPPSQRASDFHFAGAGVRVLLGAGLKMPG